MDNTNLDLVAAFSAGLLSFASPCLLPLLPVYLGYIAGAAAVGSKAASSRLGLLWRSLLFVAGFSLVFVALGALAGMIGLAFTPYLPPLKQAAGVLLIILGLHVWGALRLPLLNRSWGVGRAPSGERYGAASALLIGMLFAVGWTPCVGPVLAGILLLAGNSQTVGQGALLLAVYSLGLGLPFVLAALLTGQLSGILRRLNRHLRLVELLSGLLLIALGVLLLGGWLERVSGLL